jgi:hypothetical protein
MRTCGNRAALNGTNRPTRGNEFPIVEIGFGEGCWRDRPWTRTQESEFTTACADAGESARRIVVAFNS